VCCLGFVRVGSGGVAIGWLLLLAAIFHIFVGGVCGWRS